MARQFSRGQGAQQWHLRVDKEEFTMSLISVLRANLLRLLISPHDPQQFMAAQGQGQATTSEEPVSGNRSPPLSPTVVQLSAMVVDLAAPRFLFPFNPAYTQLDAIIDTDIQLFLPALNPVQLHFLQNLKKSSVHLARTTAGANPVATNCPESQCTATRQFYEAAPPPCYAGCHPLRLLQEYKSLNSGQQNAVKKVIASKDYTLLLGMPGSGKTSTLSFIVRMLVARGEVVLLTSYTNAAVDNLMNKLRESGVSPAVMGRLGHAGSVDTYLKEYAVLDSDNNITSATVATAPIQALASRVKGYRIFGATVLTAARSSLLQKLAPFDWCVMDEAGQISQPAALGGMLLAQKHLLVGDNYQLPPLVVSLEAQVEVTSTFVVL